MKKCIIAVITAISLLLPFVDAFAAISIPERPIEYSSELFEKYETALNAFREAILHGETDIDFGTELAGDEGNKLTYMLIYFFHFKNFTAKQSGDKMTGIQVVYPDKLTHEEIQTVYNEFDKILGLITPDMTDMEKALIVHDYMALNYRYDQRYLSDELTDEAYTGVGLINNKMGVCQAYATMYQYIMYLLKIPCELIISNSMNHEWNAIQLDGEWYHIDVTWDDSIFKKPGYVSHKHFLFSDSAAAGLDHKDWETYLECSDTRYDDAFWKNIDSHIIPIDGKLYYYNRGVCRRSSYIDEEEVLYEGEYLYSYGFGCYEGNIYFLKEQYTADYKYDLEIYAYGLETEAVEATTISWDADKVMDGFYVDGNYLYYTIRNRNGPGTEEIKVNLNDKLFPPPDCVMTIEGAGMDYSGEGNKTLETCYFNITVAGKHQKCLAFLAIYDETGVLVKILSKDMVMRAGHNYDVPFENINLTAKSGTRFTAKVIIFRRDYMMMPLAENNDMDFTFQ